MNLSVCPRLNHVWHRGRPLTKHRLLSKITERAESIIDQELIMPRDILKELQSAWSKYHKCTVLPLSWLEDARKGRLFNAITGLNVSRSRYTTRVSVVNSSTRRCWTSACLVRTFCANLGPANKRQSSLSSAETQLPLCYQSTKVLRVNFLAWGIKYISTAFY